MPRLVVACELTTTIAHDDQRETVGVAVADALAQRLGLATEVQVLPIGTIPRIEVGKAQRVAVRTADHDPLADWV
jgi:hypothetical protein